MLSTRFLRLHNQPLSFTHLKELCNRSAEQPFFPLYSQVVSNAGSGKLVSSFLFLEALAEATVGSTGAYRACAYLIGFEHQWQCKWSLDAFSICFSIIDIPCMTYSLLIIYNFRGVGGEHLRTVGPPWSVLHTWLRALVFDWP